MLNLENAASSRTLVVGVGGHGVGIIAGRALIKRVGDEHALGEVVSQEHTVSGLQSAVSSVSKRNLHSKILKNGISYSLVCLRQDVALGFGLQAASLSGLEEVLESAEGLSGIDNTYLCSSMTMSSLQFPTRVLEENFGPPASC